MIFSAESRANNTSGFSPHSRSLPTVAPSEALGPSSSSRSGELSRSFHVSSTHSTLEPSDSQSAASRSLSFTGPRPMPSSTFISSQFFSETSRTISKPEKTDNTNDSMTTGTTSSNQASSTSVKNNGAATPPAPADGGGSETTALDPPPKTSQEDTNQPPKTGGTTSSSTTAKAAPSPTTGSGKKVSTSAKQTVSQTVEVISVKPSNTSTIFMTVTSSPQTTLSIPSSIPVTNSQNGVVVLSAPSLITVLSTSTGSDGALVTQTQLVANPPVSVDGKASTGFLDHHGQVAGVFAVVGVFAAAFVFALIWFIRRHRRIQRRREWFASLRQYPPSPFAEASQSDGQMRSIHTTTETIHDPRMVNYEHIGYRPQSSLESTAEGSPGLGLISAGNAPAGVLVPLRRPNSGEDPFRDPPHVPRNTPVSFSPNHDRLNESSGASIAPSSPSIYPESLPPVADNPNPVDSEPKIQAKYFSEPLLRRSLSITDAPPRPPRSHLRESQKASDVFPITPPASVSSHGHSDQEPQFLFHPMRRNTAHVRREVGHI